jgi:hypothetical protein
MTNLSTGVILVATVTLILAANWVGVSLYG